SLVDEHGPPGVAQACDFIRQGALGLQHACEQALVHRDIKPANLMVTLPGQPGGLPAGKAGAAAFAGALVKILDMGVARLYQSPAQPFESITTLTQDGAVIGTPDYVAPEQLEDAHAADIRADRYSLGCTFYSLLTGRPPFSGNTVLQKLDKHRWETPPSVDQLRPEVPAAIAAVVRKLMAKSPPERYRSPGDL